MCVDVCHCQCVCVCLQNQLKVKIDSYKQAQSNISSRQTKYVELRIHSVVCRYSVWRCIVLCVCFRLRGIENTHFDVAAEEEKLKQEVEKVYCKLLSIQHFSMYYVLYTYVHVQYLIY